MVELVWIGAPTAQQSVEVAQETEVSSPSPGIVVVDHWPSARWLMIGEGAVLESDLAKPTAQQLSAAGQLMDPSA